MTGSMNEDHAHASGSAVHPLQTPAPGHYRLDPARTTIRFRTRHMFGLGVVRGAFTLRGGYVDVADSIDDSKVQAVVIADSIDTGRPARDQLMRSKSYLDVARYPDLRFVSHSVEATGSHWIVQGTLYAHGVPVPLRLAVNLIHASAHKVAFYAGTRVDRYAHGIRSGRFGIAGRRLAIDITAVAVPAH